MPEVTVAAGGRIFKAFGHIAHKANQNPVLNTLYCINAYNGTVLWKRDLSAGYHDSPQHDDCHSRDTLSGGRQVVQTDRRGSGNVREEIVVPEGLADGAVWKWMAMKDGVLYALVGGPEIQVDTITSSVRGIGHWPWGMWKGHDYSDPKTNFGYGRTFLAIDPETKELLWSYRDEQYIDARGVCMSRGGRIYFCSPEKFLGCLNCEDGRVLWKNADESLLQAIGPNGRAQHYVTGYATTTYIKCNDNQLFFAGPQRSRFVVASTEDGRLLWEKQQGNVQVVLRDDGVYCAGPQMGDDMAGAKYSYDGQRLASLPIRRACTRATGSIDGIFYRTSGGTVRYDTASNSAEHIAPMRPPCQDGVIISDGLLFWGPWMCGCQLSLYGHICLGSARAQPAAAAVPEAQLQLGAGDPTQVEGFAVETGDWPAYQHDNWRSSFTRATVPESVELLWERKLLRGSCRALRLWLATRFLWPTEAASYVPWGWTVSCAGARQREVAIYYPPTLDDGRLFAGTADGRVYALEAATGRLLWSYRVAPRSALDSRVRAIDVDLAGSGRCGRAGWCGLRSRRDRSLRWHVCRGTRCGHRQSDLEE